MQEGSYDIQVIVKDDFHAATGESASASYAANSRVVGPGATISPTSNPLVAPVQCAPLLRQFDACRVPTGGPRPFLCTTAPLPIVPGQSTNVLVAGLLPDTTYLMRHVLDDGTASAPLTFHTGALPTSLTFPTFTVQQSPTPETDPTQDMVFHVGINPPDGTVNTLATDLTGNIVWYYDPVANNFPSYAPSLVTGGTVLLLGGEQDHVGGANTLREVDLAGNTLRETNIDAVNAQLAALGQDPITDFNHDVQRLPNGDTVVLSTTPRTIDVDGTPTRYSGDMVIILDQNFQVEWTWDSFDWLDTDRLRPLGEGPGDWTHANAVAWSPADGNLLVSLRAQDWVIKIDYEAGTGDGHVIWRLGEGGDFNINSSDPSPWFSHQHDARYVNNSTLVLFDNGNTRILNDPQGHSRGQELVLDETTMQATLAVNADLGSYASAMGSGQKLPNGNFGFTSAFAQQTIEVSPDGLTNYVVKMNMPGAEYRSYLYGSLYGDLANLFDPGFEDPIQGTGTTAYQYAPTGSAWSFGGPAGVAGNGSALTSGNPDAPQGSQVAFLQNTGTIRQVMDFPAAGAYTIGLSAAQQGNVGNSNATVEVRVDGALVGIFAPAGTGYDTYTTGSFRVSAGSHTITFVGVDPDGAGSTALLDQVRIHNAAPVGLDVPGFVNLSSAFNRIGAVADGTAFGGGGLDGDGTALSSSLVGSSLVAGGTTFGLGPAGAPNVVAADGQVIPLLSSRNGTLKLLATGVNGAQTNQVFLVTYTDGTTASFTQSISDWAFPQGHAGESMARTTGYRNTSVGQQHAGGFHIYEYTFALDPNKVVNSLTLPVNANVEVFAATLGPPAPAPPDPVPPDPVPPAPVPQTGPVLGQLLPGFGTVSPTVSSISRPRFTGIAPARSVVRLYALNAAGTRAYTLGAAFANRAGQWRMMSRPLPAGSYYVLATSSPFRTPAAEPPKLIWPWDLGPLIVQARTPPSWRGRSRS